LKNNTEVANSKCYTFASSALLRHFFTSNFKNDDKYLAPPESFFLLPELGWAGYGPDFASCFSRRATAVAPSCSNTQRIDIAYCIC